MRTLEYKAPGVYVEEIFPPPALALRTGVPVFLGLTQLAPAQKGDPESHVLTCWPQFVQKFGEPVTPSFLPYALRGFFENGGRLCYVLPLRNSSEMILRQGLEALESWNSFDLVCAPDVMIDPSQAMALQKTILDFCEKTGDCFALLDSLGGTGVNEVLQQRQALRSTNGALYYPWVRITEGPDSTGGFVPPCGHVAGVYARSDRQIGVHKAPANEVLKGVVDLEYNVSRTDQEQLNPFGVNCLRAFPGRGIRVWGARTLSGLPAWTYVNVRRLFMTAARWCEQNLANMVFEPHHPRLWARIERALTAYFTDMFSRGALKGTTVREAFYVKCDAETNPAEVRESGRIVAEIGLAPTVPSEFVVVRIIHDATGTALARPNRSN
jgi:hypothetical protein